MELKMGDFGSGLDFLRNFQLGLSHIAWYCLSFVRSSIKYAKQSINMERLPQNLPNAIKLMDSNGLLKFFICIRKIYSDLMAISWTQNDGNQLIQK